jgi:hypothetical protein
MQNLFTKGLPYAAEQGVADSVIGPDAELVTAVSNTGVAGTNCNLQVQQADSACAGSYDRLKQCQPILAHPVLSPVGQFARHTRPSMAPCHLCCQPHSVIHHH